MIEAIVLAAGFSHRMGAQNKLLLSFRDQPMLRCVLEELIDTSIQRIIVVTGFEHEKIVTIPPPSEKITVVYNPNYQRGQITSVQFGIQSLSDDATGFMICLSDMPFLTSDHYEEVIRVFDHNLPVLTYPIIVPNSGKRPGNPVLFHRQFIPDFLALTDAENGKIIMQRSSATCFSMMTIHPHYFIDIDTPEDYQEYGNRFWV
ncbi:MAG: nucleotidyltransferase family protein [Saprospiraceae bacterium]|nr:nucleotidyltransferase family protein [Saprospiraceae bacterium]